MKMAPKEGPPDSSVKLKCERALASLRRGDHNRALKLIKDSISRHSNCAILHHTRATIHFKTASLTHNSNTKLQHLKNAADAARQALVASPKSISFLLFYAKVLFELAARGEKKGYQEVVRECQRALMMEEPVDPLEDGLHQEEESDEIQDSSQESRIENVKRELRELMEKCKSSGDGSRKDKSKKVGEQMVPASQINKELKAKHEKKKEIESRGLVARLLHQKKLAAFEFLSLGDEVKDRRKNTSSKIIISNSERMDQVKTYWKEVISFEKKRGLLNVGIKELKAHFSKNKWASEVLKEAIDFAKKENQWEFWVCCCCGERFRDSKLTDEHLKSKHMGNISVEFLPILPEVAGDECLEIVENGGLWKPVHILASEKLIENQSRFESSEVRDSHSADDPDENQKWPVSDDCERTVILERIRGELQWFLRSKCLAVSLLEELKAYAMARLLTRVPESQIKSHGLDKTLFSICFLGAPELYQVLGFLEERASACCLNYLSVDSISDDELEGVPHGLHVKEKISFSTDFSCLIMGERLLQGELNGSTYQDTIADEGTSINPVRESDELAFVKWLLTGPPIEEQLEAWARLREACRNQGMELFQIHENELSCLQKTCKTKNSCLFYVKKVQEIETCLEQYKRSEQITEDDPESCASLLLKMQKELEKDLKTATEVWEQRGIDLKARLISRTLQAEAGNAEPEIKNKRLKMIRQVYELDATILAIKAAMRQTELKLTAVSAYDYRWIMVHILKSFMRENLENLVHQDLLRKSDAAMEAFVAELALDGKNSNKGGDNLRQKQGKLKNKKKKKDQKKTNEPCSWIQFGTLNWPDFLRSHPLAHPVDMYSAPS